MRPAKGDSRDAAHIRVLGIDPGTVTTGYGVVEDGAGRLHYIASGGIVVPPRAPLPHRLNTIFQAITHLIAEYRPSAVAVEDTFMAKNAKAAMTLGQARGIVLLAAAQADLPVVEYAPRAIKLAVTGYGAADKAQVGVMVARLLGLTGPPAVRRADIEHAADALATAICHLNSHRFQAAVQSQSASAGRVRLRRTARS